MLLVALVSQQPWAAGMRGAAKSLLAPLEEGMTAVAAQAGSVTALLGDISSLRSENDRLRAADATLRQQVVELNAAAKENASLRQSLDFERSYGHHMVAGQVIGRGPDGFSRTLEIDRGTADGVQTGMVVVTGSGLLGRVSETGPHSSIVQTLADPRSRVNVYLDKSGFEGIVSGGPDALHLQMVRTVGVAAATGEWALTSGIGGAYPRGLVVGEIASVGDVATPAAGSAILAWVNDPSAVSFVLVITDFKAP